MNAPSESSIFRSLFENALREYEAMTDTSLVGHPFALELEKCNSIESITVALEEQAQAFGRFRGKDGKLMKFLKGIVHVLYSLSTGDVLARAISISFPPANAIFAGMGILLTAVKDISASYDSLADLFEVLEHFLMRLNIYTKMESSPAMSEIIVKILVALLSTLALVTKEIKRGKRLRLVKFGTRLFGEKDVEAVLQRLDRLTQDEARIVAAQTLEVVYGLVGFIKAVLGEDDLEESTNNVRKTLVGLQKMASEMNASKRRQLRDWLSPPDSWEDYNNAYETLLDGTAIWFTKGDTFERWKSSGTLLWIHGKPGSGKTVLSSAIIQDIEEMSELGLASMAFFFCNFRDDKKQSTRNLLSSILVQLCGQSDTYYNILSKFHSAHNDGWRQPRIPELKRCIMEMINSQGQAPIFIIVDAIDECKRPSDIQLRNGVLKVVKELVNLGHLNLRVCITSRPERGIQSALNPIASESISLHDEEGQRSDINKYIKTVVNADPEDNDWTEDDKDLVIDTLSARADGMFQWVSCQVNYLLWCRPQDIRSTLDGLPTTLEESYSRSLKQIEENKWKHAHRLFQCVAVSSRPFLVEELAGFLAFDFDAGPVPKFLLSRLPPHPEQAVLSTSTSLLVITHVGDSQVIQFSHHSVKDFLTSERIASDEAERAVSRYQILIQPANSIVARACLALLLQLGANVNAGKIETNPLSRYAAQHWVDHAEREQMLPDTQDVMRRLLDPKEPHLAVWFWICDVVLHIPLQTVSQKVEHLIRNLNGSSAFQNQVLSTINSSQKLKPQPLAQSIDTHEKEARIKAEPTPLFWALKNELSDFYWVLLEHGADVNVWDDNRETPLYWASRSGDSAIVQSLLEHGAKTDTGDDYNRTPLHVASEKGFPEVVQLLLRQVSAPRGEDANASDDYNKTPLHWAAEGGFLQVVTMLLEHGADTDARDDRGQTPSDAARVRGHHDVAQSLSSSRVSGHASF